MPNRNLRAETTQITGYALAVRDYFQRIELKPHLVDESNKDLITLFDRVERELLVKLADTLEELAGTCVYIGLNQQEFLAWLNLWVCDPLDKESINRSEEGLKEVVKLLTKDGRGLRTDHIEWVIVSKVYLLRNLYYCSLEGYLDEFNIYSFASFKIPREYEEEAFKLIADLVKTHVGNIQKLLRNKKRKSTHANHSLLNSGNSMDVLKAKVKEAFPKEKAARTEEAEQATFLEVAPKPKR